MKSLQLVCINYGNVHDAVKAMNHCIEVFPRFEAATLIHPDPSPLKERPTSFHPLIKVVQAFSPTQNECCLYEMPQHVKCDHALGIQWDGFIVRPDLWSDEFLEYDLIAPPWPLTNLPNPEHRVGSGGFVMFSRRMCQLWGSLCSPHPVLNDWEMGTVQRASFEKRGMKYAPIELAARFGKEIDCPDYPVPEGESYGFHGFQYNSEHRKKYKEMIYGT